MIKAVFFDIDGTLVSFKTHRIPESTIKALGLLRQKGVKLFIATGRPFVTIDNLGEQTFDGYITMNGGYCMGAEKEVIYRRSISAVDIAALVEYLQKEFCFPCMAATEDAFAINYIDQNVSDILKLIHFPVPAIAPLEESGKNEIYQLMAFVDKPNEDHLLKEVIPGCEATRWNPLFTDIVPKGVSKQSGIDQVLEYYGIKLEETMAFGDGGNDISMLKHVPKSVAMGNASDEVKAAAAYVTDSVDEDGIYKALQEFFVL